MDNDGRRPKSRLAEAPPPTGGFDEPLVPLSAVVAMLASMRGENGLPRYTWDLVITDTQTGHANSLPMVLP